MKISTNWIKELIDIDDISLEELADKITNAGVNVENVSASLDTSKLVVGKIIDCVPHPDSDHLNLCKVDIKEEVLDIVCGAPNARKGINVIVAKVGAILPGDFEIKERVVRGEKSVGMLCSLTELGLEDPTPDGIFELPADAIVGDSIEKYVNTGDRVYTLDLNPNRNDCLSHIGFAYEAAAAINKKLHPIDLSYNESNESVKDELSVKVDTERCKLYLAKKVKNITIKESPDFIKNRLTSAGMRPINNVVDISNYVMLLYGQPLHFFDADFLNGKILVRDAKDGEKTITLDEKELELNKNDIVITNGEVITCLAGVMGSLNSGVSEKTKDIVIESAIFDALSVRNTSIKYNLRSEASLRFEKGLNYEYTYDAINYACHLLEKYADATVLKDTVEYNELKVNEKKCSVSLSDINRILGVTLTIDDVKDSFDRLGFPYEVENEMFNVVIPNRRMDVSIMEDLVEEVGRMYGFHNIKATYPICELKRGTYAPRIKFRKDIDKRMRMLGLDQVRTYSLVNEENANRYNLYNQNLIKLDRPISNDRTHLRSSLIPSLLEVLNYNINRSVKPINIFEISNTYTFDKEYKEEMKLCVLMYKDTVNNLWKNDVSKLDFYSIKGKIEALFRYLNINESRIKYEKNENISFLNKYVSADIIIDNDNVGFIGKLNDSIVKDDTYVCEINLEKLYNLKSEKLKFVEPSKYPTVKRDLAFIVDKDLEAKEIIKTIKSKGGKYLKDVHIFDIYSSKDTKSIGFNLLYEDNEKTLVDDIVNESIDQIINSVEKKYNAKLRDK